MVSFQIKIKKKIQEKTFKQILNDIKNAKNAHPMDVIRTCKV